MFVFDRIFVYPSDVIMPLDYIMVMPLLFLSGDLLLKWSAPLLVVLNWTALLRLGAF